MNEAPSASPGDILPFVREQISEFVKDAPQFDDITMLGLRYIGKKATDGGGGEKGHQTVSES